MSSRPSVKRAGQTSPPAFTSSAQLPPLMRQLTPESKISASCISLSSGFVVHYAVLSVVHASQSHLDIDLARRRIYENNSGKRIEDSLLTYSQITKDGATLWVFFVDQNSSGTEATDFLLRLQSLEFTGLTIKSHDKFSYQELYPCSVTCSVQRTPCPTCLRSCHYSESSHQGRISTAKLESGSGLGTLASKESEQSSGCLPAACHLPRCPLRQALAFFLKAVQERIIDDICNNNRTPGIVTRRFRTGVLWGPANPLSHWGDGWDQHWKTRPLSYCHIEVTLLAPGILIQPRFLPTHFLPLQFPLPLIPGTPINLLPFSTPAYYLNMYSGPTSALLKQFQANLVGLGAGDLQLSLDSNRGQFGSENVVPFVIAWISVQNKQGEEKGMIVIWPAPLCVSLMSMPETPHDPDSPRLYAYNRKPLAYIPELPIALQPSPVPAPATVPRAFSPHESLISPSLFTPIGRTLFSRETTPTTPFPRSATQTNRTERDLDRPPLTRATSSFSSSTAQAFRSLCISHQPPKDLRNVAEGVGKFVDSIAKERERERERIKREKEREANALHAQSQAHVLAMKSVGTPQSPGVVPPSTSSIPGTSQMDTDNDNGTTRMSPPTSLPKQTFVHPAQAQIQHPPISASNPSYPSPPEEVVKAEQSSSFGNNTVGPSSQQIQPPPTSEPFGSFDGMDKFMMDLGMDFNMTLPSTTSHSGENIKVDFDSLGVFTDDDFSFFDDPVVTTTTSTLPTSTSAPETTSMSSEEAIKSLAIPPLGQVGTLPGTVVPGSAISLVSFDKASPWSTSKQGADQESKERMESTAPELLPGSPGESIVSSNGPRTPEVISITDAETVSSKTRPFDAIRFSKRFNSVDAKYVIGKFSNSLIDKTDSATREDSLMALWKMSYDSKTDPRIEIVKKLIGMKRRLAVQGIRLGPPCPPFQDTQSEWESYVDEDLSAMDVDSDRDSDSEDQNPDDYEGSDSVSRPSTPLTSHLPLGPTLLSTQFKHSLLLPLSINLRPPGASFATTLDLASPLPNPVPTPVSPAAVVGSRNEKSKALEIAMRVLASELIENTLWETAWRVSTTVQAPIWRQDESEQDDSVSFLSMEWPWDAMRMESFSSLVSITSSFENLSSPASSLPLKALDQPMFTIGKADTLVQMLPSSLRFWSKLGLTPRSGPKNVSAFMLYEECSRPTEELERWLNRTSCIYNAKGYGKLSLGKSDLYPKGGFVPFRYATFRKTLATLVDSFSKITFPLVIYVVISSPFLSLSSPILRQMFQSIDRSLSNRQDDAVPILFHFVPDFLLTLKDDVNTTFRLETFVDNLYNRIPRPVDRFMSRPLFVHDGKIRKYFEAPSFTLSRSSLPTASLAFQHPAPEFSSFDRGTFLHLGYELSKCRKWLIAACIDQRGEAHSMNLWFVGDESDYKQLVSQLWSFLMDFAKMANVEWRVAIAKLGSVEEAELTAWSTHLNDVLSSDGQIPPMQVSLLCVDDESGWSVLTERPSSPLAQKSPSSTDSYGKNTGQVQSQAQGQGSSGQTQGQVFSSINSTYIIPSLRYPLPSTSDFELGVAHYIPEDEDSAPRLPNAERLRPLLTSALITVGNTTRAQYVHLLHSTTTGPSNPSSSSSLAKSPRENLDDICRNYHELAVLTQARWPHLNLHGERKGVTAPVLPYHLAALRLINSALEMDEVSE
ncbi:hypothetical protein ACEPAH_6217 [Sanghuangporus vaninii]